MLLSFFFSSGEFLLHIRCWLHFYVGSFSCISHAGVIFIWGVSLTHPELAFIGSADTSASFLCGEFLLHIPCWLFFFFFFFFFFYLGSFSYTSRAGFFFSFFLSGEFLLHISGWLHFYQGSISYTSLAGVIFIWGVSLTHPWLASFLSGEFLLHVPARFIFIWGVSLTHPWLASFLSGEFLLHIPS